MSVQMRVTAPASTSSSVASSYPVLHQNILKRIWSCFVSFLANLGNTLKNCISSWFRAQPKVLQTPVEKAQEHLRTGFDEIRREGGLMPCKAAVIFKQGNTITNEHTDLIDSSTLEKFCETAFSNLSGVPTSILVLLVEKCKPTADLVEGNSERKTLRIYQFSGEKWKNFTGKELTNPEWDQILRQ